MFKILRFKFGKNPTEFMLDNNILLSLQWVCTWEYCKYCQHRKIRANMVPARMYYEDNGQERHSEYWSCSVKHAVIAAMQEHPNFLELRYGVG